MTKSTKMYTVVLGLVFLAVAAYGWLCEKDVWGEENPNRILERNPQIVVSIDEGDVDSPYFCNAAECTLKELEARADLIAIVSLGEVQTAKHYSTKSKIKLEKILAQRDGTLTEGDEIWMEELATVFVESSYDTEGYALMKPGQQYLLLLQHLPCIEGYRYSEEEALTYTPVSMYFGKYCITDNETIEVVDATEAENIYYSQVFEYALFTRDPKKVANYKKLYQEVLQKWEQ